ncbi:MAG: C40 family peptidase [Flavobacteriaceae bacterium]
MSYGICALSIIPLQSAAQSDAPMISELLYGEIFSISKKQNHWVNVLLPDGTQGWIEQMQCREITPEEFELLSAATVKVAADMVQFICKDKEILFPISIGSLVHNSTFLGHNYEGNTSGDKVEKANIREMAFIFLNAPHRHGGKSPFGIDSAGFAQTVYRLCGISLPRTASAQAEQGEVLSFIEETEVGDLAFFDDEEGIIKHVGIILENNHIIHSYGKVRVDRLDQTGIFNNSLRTHTHKLRVIKKII